MLLLAEHLSRQSYLLHGHHLQALLYLHLRKEPNDVRHSHIGQQHHHIWHLQHLDQRP